MSEFEDIRIISETVYEFLLNTDMQGLKVGKILLKDGVYVNVDEYMTSQRSARRYESHKRYIDVQIMIRGSEEIEISPIKNLNEIEPYDEGRDVIFYDNTVLGSSHIIHSGDYVICMPEDGHMPCICHENEELVKKAVIKIPVNC